MWQVLCIQTIVALYVSVVDHVLPSITMRITSGIHVTSRLMRKHLENKTCFHICTSTNIKVSVPNRNNCNTESKYAKPTRHLIKDITEVSTDHMTPEIGLHLVTPNCPLWHSRGEDCPFEDPFWAFYWPGGQALTRYGQFKYLLDVHS